MERAGWCEGLRGSELAIAVAVVVGIGVGWLDREMDGLRSEQLVACVDQAECVVCCGIKSYEIVWKECCSGVDEL